MRKICALLTTALLALPATALAETTGAMTFGEIIAAGGWPMKVIIAFSVIGLFLVLFYLLTFRAGILFPSPFMNEVNQAAEDGDLEALQAACAAHTCPAARIMAAATEQMMVAERVDYMAARDAIEDEGARQAGSLWQRLQYLMDVAVISPMVGLLGTVLGMLQSFAEMEVDIGAVRPATLSQGVAKALITTAGGLIVGIAAMVLYAIFRGRVNQLIGRLEENCGVILRRFISNYGRGRQG